MSTTLDLAIELISRPSVTPNDVGCQALIAERLKPLDFSIEHLRFGEVDNLWARRGNAAPLFVFIGHTDVVPAGESSAWNFPPFTPTLYQGLLYGRGAADMKGSLAAALAACERFVHQYPQHSGSIAFLITSDEEGTAINGTAKVVEHLLARQERIDYCLVAEPTSDKRLADTIKHGRRGSLSGYLIVQGIQGHVAYPHLADNPIHRFSSVLQHLCDTRWDEGNQDFPPTTFQISNIHAGTGANNVIPGQLTIDFNFRYSTEVTHDQLKQKIIQLLEQQGLNYQLRWEHSGQPYITRQGLLLEAMQQAISEECGYSAELSTSGGISDGRFIAPTGAQVLELGPSNATIHKVNECISIDDLEKISLIYQRILEKILIFRT